MIVDIEEEEDEEEEEEEDKKKRRMEGVGCRHSGGGERGGARSHRWR